MSQVAQGAFFIFGFFALANGNRAPVQKPPPSPSKKAAAPAKPSSHSTWFNFYATTIQRPDDPVGLPAEVRIYSPPLDVPHPDNTIAFIVAKAYIPVTGPILLDAICMYPIPGDPQSDDYEDRVPDMLYPFVYGLGATQGKAENLADGKSKGFSVNITERVRDKQETSSVHCVLDAQSPRWINVPPPSPNTLVSFLGVCSHIRPGRKLSVALEMLVYNPSAAPPSIPVPPPDADASTSTPSGKRRKFLAVHVPTTAVAGPSTPTPSVVVAVAPSAAEDVFESDLSPTSSREDLAGSNLNPVDGGEGAKPIVSTRANKGKRKAD